MVICNKLDNPMLKKISEKTENSNLNNYKKYINEYYLGPGVCTSRQDMISANQTHKSKYTSTSKLTQSHLFRTLSGTDLREKNKQVLKTRET